MPRRISVVTSSYNQGQFIGRTIQSVLEQDYPNIEHIVVDGMSTDETPTILSRYPHLKVIREPDSGQSEAINKGFRSATGDIFCFLNSDDLFLPGALKRVAEEIDPARGRHVVTGRSAYIGVDDQPTGLEHRTAVLSHDRILEVWKGHCIAQPATFWTRNVWQECGPLNESEHLVLDYDLMCRISQRYRIHSINQVLAGYRLHTSSKGCSHTHEQVEKAAIRTSRSYWGSPWKPQYWRLLYSLALHRFEQRFKRREKAASLTILSDVLWKQGARKRAFTKLLRGALLAPEIVLRRFFGTHPARTWQDSNQWETTPVWRNFRGYHEDGCVGPCWRDTIQFGQGSRELVIDAIPFFNFLPRPLNLELAIDGRPVLRQQVTTPRPFTLTVPVGDFVPGVHLIEASTDYFIIPHDVYGNTDYRPLVFREWLVRVSQERSEAKVQNGGA
jgi:glycosyltransferase involved in cell wall biosynthesis